jgi:hypothetical protein
VLLEWSCQGGKEDEMDRTCNTYGNKNKAFMISVGKLERNKPLGRPRRRCVDNSEIILREIGLCDMDWIELAHDKGSCKCGNELSDFTKYWKILE